MRSLPAASSDMATLIRRTGQTNSGAAETMPLMLESLLGLVPNAFENHLPLELRRLRVGEATVDLSFNRRSDGSLAADVIKVDGKLNVEFASESHRAAA